VTIPSKTVVVTGASAGIGAATARRLAAMGHTVYAAARRADRLDGLTGVRPLVMDVTDDESMVRGVRQVIEGSGRIDVLVNNAGYGSYGALEDVPLDEGRRQFDVNIFGAVRMIQLVLPHMRAQRSGTIVNISSMGGRIYTPLGGWYHGTKHAIEGISDCLRIESKPFGIDVVVVEPGSTATEWGDIAGEALLATSGKGAYADQAHSMARTLTQPSPRSSSPEVIANAVARAISANRPKTRYVVGYGARPLLLARRLLSDRMFDRLITRASGVH
jgi:NAD(P)-dependent dehydrogenase (short-subunit alcohol dehydrogenase family)